MAKEGNFLINFLNGFDDIFIIYNRCFQSSTVLCFLIVLSPIFYRFILFKKIYKISKRNKIQLVAIYNLTLLVYSKVSQVFARVDIFEYI